MSSSGWGETSTHSDAGVTPRVIVASDLALTRESVSSLLRTSPELEVLRPTSIVELQACVEAEHPSVVVLALASGLDAGPQLVTVARLMSTSFPALGLVVISPHGEGLVAPLLQFGPKQVSFLLDHNIRDLDFLVRVVRNLAEGVVTIDADVMELITRQGELPGLSVLTPRELDVLTGIARGLTNPSVAAEIHISVKAVEANVTSIFRKLRLEHASGIDRRVTAALIFLRGHESGSSHVRLSGMD